MANRANRCNAGAGYHLWDQLLIRDMDDKVYEQTVNVATLRIVKAAYVMPDAHWGYGFPIGGEAAFDAEKGGVFPPAASVSMFCGVRTMLTSLKVSDIFSCKRSWPNLCINKSPPVLVARVQSRSIHLRWTRCLEEAPVGHRAGLGQGSRSRTHRGGWPDGRRAAVMCVGPGEGTPAREMGTLGSGNHYLEIQAVTEIFDEEAAMRFGLKVDEVVVTIHCGSRGLGHQIGTEFLREMLPAAAAAGIALPDRELACAPIKSEIGQRYLGAMRAAVNCALANREVIGHYARRVFAHFFPNTDLALLFDVSHNTCKAELHRANGGSQQLFVHRKGATRAFGPNHPDLPEALRETGQPVLIGGSMGTGSYVLVGAATSEAKSFASACHGAGRAMSRHAALRAWSGRQIVDELAQRGILIRSPSARGVAEEAPGAYKDVGAVVLAAEQAGLARRVARLRPLICIKG